MIKASILSFFLILLFSPAVMADNIAMISEPVTLALLGMGLLGTAGVSKKMFQK